MDTRKLQAWWAHCQGLDGSLEGKNAAEVLEATGWARSVGGAGPYIGLFARAGLSREAVDAAVARLEIHELPSARGCTHVLPSKHFALGLKVGRGAADGEMRVALKLGVSEKEIDKLCDAVLKALKTAPLDPEQLKEATGGASRSLGPEGQKKGVSSTMPLALGRLQESGHIRRIPTNGRIDQQRYKYALWSPNPLAGFNMSAEEAFTELARLYFQWIGPATMAQFQWFSGLGVKAAKGAVTPLKLREIGGCNGFFLHESDVDAWERFAPPKRAHYVLAGSLDNLALLRRDLSALIDETDQKLAVPTEKGAKAVGGLTDLPSHAITDRGRVTGLWEFDTASNSIAWMSFVKPDKAMKDAVAKTEAFVRDQLGDARSFSLDSPKSRAPKIEALKKMWGEL
jgi:hypothetical protein